MAEARDLLAALADAVDNWEHSEGHGLNEHAAMLDATSDARAFLAQPATPVGALDVRIREALWRLHGHDFIYGDDGEMQCNWLHHRTDFKRDPFDRLLDHCDLARLLPVNVTYTDPPRLAAASEPAGGGEGT